MKPDAYMPYYGSAFETATKGLRREVKWSYLAACWHYWTHTHCEGLPSDDEPLRLICDCPEAEWSRTKGSIFGPLFHMESGLWHQKRTREIYHETMDAYNARVASAANARRIKNLESKPDTNPDSNLSPRPNQNQNQNQNKSENQNQLKDVGANGSRPASKCDDEWIAVLSKSSAYQGIDVQRELGRMQEWCGVNHKQPSRRRFINWLNRCEKPMHTAPRKYSPNLG